MLICMEKLQSGQGRPAAARVLELWKLRSFRIYISQNMTYAEGVQVITAGGTYKISLAILHEVCRWAPERYRCASISCVSVNDEHIGTVCKEAKIPAPMLWKYRMLNQATLALIGHDRTKHIINTNKCKHWLCDNVLMWRCTHVKAFPIVDEYNVMKYSVA